MAKKGSLKTVRTMLDNIKKLNGERFNIAITIANNGESPDENPAYYGTILEEQRGNTANHGRYYKFLEPALEDFTTKILGNEDIKLYLDIVKLDGKKRGKKEMLEASKLYAQSAVEKVQHYILYEAPQYPDRERENPTLIETGELFDSIIYKIRDKKGREMAVGK